jgi:hypothetical protein
MVRVGVKVGGRVRVGIGVRVEVIYRSEIDDPFQEQLSLPNQLGLGLVLVFELGFEVGLRFWLGLELELR